MAKSRRNTPRLGKGLSSLIGRPVEIASPTPDDAPVDAAPAPVTPEAASTPDPAGGAVTTATEPSDPADAQTSDSLGTAGLRHLPLDAITPNPHQPRQRFAQDALESLAQSISVAGLMQPIVVRPAAESTDDTPAWELVAGERRWRAARIAGLASVPAIVRELDDQTVAEWALIENLQREDLNPIERAEAFDRLRTQFGLSHDAIAEQVGINRATVTNTLRLLTLCVYVRELVANDLLSNGQAKALAGIADDKLQTRLAERAVRESLSVRQLEKLAQQVQGGDTSAAGDGTGKGDPSPAAVRSTHFADLERQIGGQLSTRIKLKPGRKKGTGTLSIDFHSNDDFEALLDKLGVTLE